MNDIHTSYVITNMHDIHTYVCNNKYGWYSLTNTDVLCNRRYILGGREPASSINSPVYNKSYCTWESVVQIKSKDIK